MLAGVLAVVSTAILAAAPPARAATGYELDTTTPQVSLGEGVPHGIAVDQTSRRIYVAIVSSNGKGAPGEIARFESDLTPVGALSVGVEPFYAGVAVNPVTQGLYAVQARLQTPFGTFGTPQMDVFSSTGVAGPSFALTETGTLPQVATDPAGLVYYPNAAADSVQVFDSAGTLQEQIACGGCPGGGFGKPVSVALDSEDDLYVVDLEPNRVVKLTLSEGAYAFDSVLQTGQGAAGIGIDPDSDDVFVGNLPGGADYHIAAYDSSGVQFDDFGAGLFTDPDPMFGALVATQIAVDATSRDLFVGDLGKFYVFERTTISPPAVTTETANPVGQLEATLRATVNANGHAVLECEFEYTDEADFGANGFANAITEPCPEEPDGLSDTALSLGISGLSPATPYRYRVTATSYAGSTSGDPVELETLPALPPSVTPEPPSSVTPSSATVRARVNPRGGSVTDCHFEFGTSTSYGTNIPCPTMPGPVSVDVAQAIGVSGLAPSTAYHYRLVVSSNAGTTEGEDVEFKTDDPPPPEPDDDGGSNDPGPAPALNPLLPALAAPPAQRPLRCRKGFRKQRVRGKVRCVRRCPRGFRQKRVRGKVRCLNRCRRGFRKQRARRKAASGRKVRCVRVKRARAGRQQPARARRR